MPYKFISIQEMTETEVTKMFEYEDFLKDLILHSQLGEAGMLSLKSLQNRIKKIYVVPTAN